MESEWRVWHCKGVEWGGGVNLSAPSVMQLSGNAEATSRAGKRTYIYVRARERVCVCERVRERKSQRE